MQDDVGGPGTARSAEDGRLEDLKRLLWRVDLAHDAQRQALARELHHKVVGSLSAVKMECDWLQRPQRADAAIGPRLQRLSEQLGQTIEFTRQLIHELWPAIVGHLGLSSAIQEQVAEVKSRTAAAIEVEIEGDVDDIPEAAAVTLYRLIQQVLERCEAQAAQVLEARITLRRAGPKIELHIELDAALAVDDAWLLTQERVARLGGQFSRGAGQPGRSYIDVVLPAAA
jgi:signal transduction histidine kinase